MCACYIWTFYIEILVVSTVLIITYLYTQDCHDSVTQNSQGEFVSLDSYPDCRTFFQLLYWILYLCHLIHYLTACKMVHLKRKCSIFSSFSRGQVIIPTAHYCDGPLFRQPIALTAHYSDSPFLRQPIIPSNMVKSSIIILKPVVFLLYLTEDWL